MNTIKNINKVKVGGVYKMISHRFNSKNKIVCIAEDITGLSRNIRYFCFKDRIRKVPTSAELIQAMQDDATVLPDNYTTKQLKTAERMLEIRRNIFAMWDFELSKDCNSLYRLRR